MTSERRRLAGQVLLAFAALATLLPWISQNAAAPSFEANNVLGIRLSSGIAVAVLAVAGIILAQIDFKTVWMTAGLVVAVAFKAILDASTDDHSAPLIGVWLALGAGLLASVALVTRMLQDARSHPTGA